MYGLADDCVLRIRPLALDPLQVEKAGAVRILADHGRREEIEFSVSVGADAPVGILPRRPARSLHLTDGLVHRPTPWRRALELWHTTATAGCSGWCFGATARTYQDGRDRRSRTLTR